MITRFKLGVGCIAPGDLAMLRDVFNTICEREHIDEQTAAADELAKRIVQLYQLGHTPQKLLGAACFEFRRRERLQGSGRSIDPRFHAISA